MRFEPIEPRLLLDADPVLVTGAIDSPGESDTYTFTLDSDSRIAFDSLTSDPNITWTLTGPRGKEVSQRALAGTGGENTDAVLDLKEGVYTLTLDGSGDSTGSYSFRLLTLSESLSTTPGTPTSGELTVGSETDSYLFAATAGDRFYFEVTSLTGPAPSWRLLDPLGKSVFSEPMANAQDVKTVALTGLYTLLIEGQPQAAASTQYGFNVQPVSDDTTLLPLNTTMNGAIAHAGQRDTFTLHLTDARQVYFDSLTDDPDLTWSLVGPRGTVVPPRALASADSVDQGGAVLFDLAPGDYTLTLDGTLAATGAYSFRLLDFSTAPSITIAIPQSGELNPANETDIYTFTANRGDRFFFDSTLPTAPSVHWRLVDSTGAAVFGPVAMADSAGDITLTRTGRYFLLIEGQVAAQGVESYGFNLLFHGNVPLPPPTAIPLAFGMQVSGGVEPVVDDRYSFTLEDDARVILDVIRPGSDVTWTLQGPRGQVASGSLSSTDGSAAGFNSPVLPLVAGEYTLSVSGRAGAQGYAFRLLNLAQATPLVLGPGRTAGTLDPGSSTAAFTFHADEGSRLAIDPVGSSRVDLQACKLEYSIVSPK